MKVLCFIHAYPPDHNAGAEWMLHAMNKFLVKQGHEVRVMVRGGSHVTTKNGKSFFKKLQKVSSFEGIPMYYEGITMYNELFKWADIVVTHLDQTGKAINLCKAFEKKLVSVMHNTHYREEVARLNMRNQYVVYNSEWVKAKMNYPNKSCVVRPPVNHKDYEVKPTGKAITLINCYEPKGGQVLVDLAKALPHRKFIGVLSYADQVVCDRKNVTYLDNTDDVKSIYKKSRIVIMPSSYESFGRVAVEASASGIPVVVTNTPGLKEALGDAGVFIENREDIAEWVAAIKKLDDVDEYKRVGELGKLRAKELTLQSENELKGYEAFLLKIKKERYHV